MTRSQYTALVLGRLKKDKMGNNKEKIFELHNYLDVERNPDEVINKILERIPDLDNVGYAGYLEKDWLKKLLEGFVFDKYGENQKYLYESNYDKEIEKICEESMEICREYINEKIHIFLFPTFDKFVIKKMQGVNGFSSWNNTILIFINFVEGWKESLKETIVHELAHALSPFYKGGDFSIGEGLILDGVAENFKDFVIGSKKSPHTSAVSKEESWKILKQIIKDDSLFIKNFDKYNEVFYGTGKYPLWAGYTIGYYLIEEYLKKQEAINWNELLKKDPKEILEETLSYLDMPANHNKV